MEVDLFNWSIGTILITAVLFFLLGSITSNDLYHLILLAIIMLVSVIVFSRKYPQLASFKSGATIGLVTMATMGITNETRGGIEDLGITFLIFLIVFFVAGYIGKASIKKYQI